MCMILLRVALERDELNIYQNRLFITFVIISIFLLNDENFRDNFNRVFELKVLLFLVRCLIWKKEYLAMKIPIQY